MATGHDPVPAIGEARTALAGRLREIRVNAGLTAGELAEATGWQRSKISKIEHVVPMVAVLSRIQLQRGDV